MTKKSIELKDIGIINFYKNKQAKNLKIILKPGRQPRVTVPYRMPFKDAENFVVLKKLWIKENLEKIKQIEEKRGKISEEEIEILRRRAKTYLPARVEELSRKHGLRYNRIFVKNLKSRWGSCSSQNNINLNLHLMRLPENLIDYVILHELAHTKEKNHGKNFYSLLNTLIINSKACDKELKKYSCSPY